MPRPKSPTKYKNCKNCDTEFTYVENRRKYCSQRCSGIASATLENREKQRVRMTGMVMGEETKKKISMVQTGKKLSEETKRKMVVSRTGQTHSKEWSLRISNALKEIYKDPTKHPSYKTGVATKENLKKYKRMKFRQWRASKKGSLGTHNYKEWEELKQFYNYMCLCCKKQEPYIKLSEDHIVPLSKGGTDYIENIQPLCISCNSKKHASDVDYRIGFHVRTLEGNPF